MRAGEPETGGFAGPSGDPDTIRAAALRFRQVSARALATSGVRGDVGADLALVWTGSAASAAAGELATLSGRARHVLPQLESGAGALSRYADALEHAIRHSRLLRGRAADAREDHARLVAVARATALDPAACALAISRADQELADGLARLHRTHGQVM
ncbi:MAG: hypothetical protein L0H79_08245, partial [Intrasporangium sp.]|uniref:hypothetical protein n=1 Tax=Intrasporangium sp. TaxID=1925024 RepID=UPI00264952D1